MNTFDGVVYFIGAIAVIMGFRAGLLRSLATILAYAIAAPIAVAITPGLATMLPDNLKPAPDRTWVLLSVAFLGIGVALGALLQFTLREYRGQDIGIFDRLMGALLGALRIALVAVLIVLIFDRIIPADRQPDFLVGSQLRPRLSEAGRMGLRSLPPEVDDTIERLKRRYGLR